MAKTNINTRFSSLLTQNSTTIKSTFLGINTGYFENIDDLKSPQAFAINSATSGTFPEEVGKNISNAFLIIIQRNRMIYQYMFMNYQIYVRYCIIEDENWREWSRFARASELKAETEE